MPPNPDFRLPTHARRSTGGTKLGSIHLRRGQKSGSYQGIIPFERTAVVVIAILFSLLFIVSISLAFVGAAEEESYFKPILDEVVASSPGIVLLGEDVDVDVDEPSVGVRWSIIGCGEGNFLNGSEGMHGVLQCGVPAIPLDIYVDGAEDAAVKYDPDYLPWVGSTGQRRIIQNLYQFDSDHVLDVHEARLFPFDNYFLTSTLRAVNKDTGENVPIQKLATIELTSNFYIVSSDVESYVNITDGSTTTVPSREIDLKIRRPTDARTYTLALFHVNWMLAHVTLGQVYLAWKSPQIPLLKRLLSVFAILLIIPQLRNTMPDAPGFDGILLDSIGFFPQMILCSISGVVLMLMLIRREPTEPSSSPREVKPPVQEQDYAQVLSVPATPRTPAPEYSRSPPPSPLGAWGRPFSSLLTLKDELSRIKEEDARSSAVVPKSKHKSSHRQSRTFFEP
ncbi:hypothetical protein GLOTRDRAFT_129965 [Gloeophyllum trabeum ATCC 11539]|uniref:Transmembrane protein n=1 Tax=Gloeophyllum trabeum (strain ATCC 11539 / FP-39264 / Madison 617) TaxID=670483 RepID=S7Q520_GLOTA|nr:uncharacterized protein GLOTRDRAFT_129965 [Gloeophyllum trabeum ATCC 11539]EPQ54613.1 hypothetical protein GLOTRDRAFT_129965 [Gloeophyllum trabeum ATCC 11539]